MKQFIKEKYNILIPTFLGIVLIIALSLYAREYKNNRYAYTDEKEVYQYFSSNKIEYKASISRNKKKAILDYTSKEFKVSLDSTPIYFKKEDRTIFPKEMSIIFPVENNQYKLNQLVEVYKENDLYHINQKRFNKVYDYVFLYDGKDLYYFPDEVTIIFNNREIKLSPMSYINCSYDNILEYYDKESDTYGIIDITGDVIVKNEYMIVDVSSDKIITNNSFTMLINDFNMLKKIEEKEQK